MAELSSLSAHVPDVTGCNSAVRGSDLDQLMCPRRQLSMKHEVDQLFQTTTYYQLAECSLRARVLSRANMGYFNCAPCHFEVHIHDIIKRRGTIDLVAWGI
jgi:hypothetical protein